MRLTVMFTAVAVLLVAGGGVLFVAQLRQGLDRSLTLTLSTRADNVASELAAVRAARSATERDGPPATVASGNDQRLLQHAMRVGPSGTFAQLLTASGQLVAGSRLLAGQPLLTPAEARRARHRTIVLDESVSLSEPEHQATLRLLTKVVHPSGDILVIAENRTVVDTAVTRSRDQILLLGFVVVLLAGSGAWMLTGAALRPVERMRREVRELEASNDDTGLQVPKTRDEIARLAETFNAVLARMHAAVTREQALVADAGHELRTPLTVLKGELELARRPNRTPAEVLAAVDVAAEETERLIHLAEDLLFLSREAADRIAEPGGDPFDLAAVVHLAAESAARVAAQRGVRVQVQVRADGQPGGPVPCVGQPDWLRRAVDNLLANAVRYSPRHGVVLVEVASQNGLAEVRVADSGPGFPPAFLPYAFDRFSRADDARARSGEDAAAAAGSGLGLAIARSIVVRHGGTATAANRRGGGAEIVLRWPQRATGVAPADGPRGRGASRWPGPDRPPLPR